MKPTEAVALCRIVKGLFPQQHIDEFTPDSWFEVLRDLRFEDCKTAVVEVAKVETWCEPAAIRRKVRFIREKRLADAPPISPPPDLSEIEYRRWLKDTHRRIADGEPVAQIEAPKRDMPALEGTFRTIDEDAG